MVSPCSWCSPRCRDVPASCFRCSCGLRCASGAEGSGRLLDHPSGTRRNDGALLRESITDSLLATQLFIAIAALTSLILAAVTAERRAAARALAGAEANSARARGRAGGAAQGRHAQLGEAAPSGGAAAAPSAAASVTGTTGLERHDRAGPGATDGEPRFPVGCFARSRRRHRRRGGAADGGSAQRVDYEEARHPKLCGASATAPRWRRRSPSGSGSVGAVSIRTKAYLTVSSNGCATSRLVAQALANADASCVARLVEGATPNASARAQQILSSGSSRLARAEHHRKVESDPQAARNRRSSPAGSRRRELARGIRPSS